MSAIKDFNTTVVGKPFSDSTELSAQVGISVKVDRAIALHANASPERGS